MSSLRAYFDLEAVGHLRRMSEVVTAEPIDGRELHRLARALRGIANLAREDHVYRAALGFEATAHALAQRRVGLDDATREKVTESLAELLALATTSEDADLRELRVSRVLERCVPLAEVPAADTAALTAAQTERERRQFRGYVAREAAGIAGVIDESMAAFQIDPLDRAPLTAVLRRHRALLGAARLDDVKIVAETLRAVEDIAGVITRLNAPVKKEWLDVFRCARDVLRGSAEALGRGEEPRPSTALSRLRTLHEELLDRFGTVEPAAPAVESPPMFLPEAPVTPVAAQPEAVIDELCYDGPTALRRALELRPRVEAALRDEPGAREVIDELFDLIRLGLE